MSPKSRVTIDHDEIREWAEERGAKPSALKKTEIENDPGVIRFSFSQSVARKNSEGSLEEIPWEEFFDRFDEKELAFLYQEEDDEGRTSKFNKLISRESTAGKSSNKNRRAA